MAKEYGHTKPDAKDMPKNPQTHKPIAHPDPEACVTPGNDCTPPIDAEVY
jgi:hypothetical protein